MLTRRNRADAELAKQERGRRVPEKDSNSPACVPREHKEGPQVTMRIQFSLGNWFPPREQGE